MAGEAVETQWLETPAWEPEKRWAEMDFLIGGGFIREIWHKCKKLPMKINMSQLGWLIKRLRSEPEPERRLVYEAIFAQTHEIITAQAQKILEAIRSESNEPIDEAMRTILIELAGFAPYYFNYVDPNELTIHELVNLATSPDKRRKREAKMTVKEKLLLMASRWGLIIRGQINTMSDIELATAIHKKRMRMFDL
jgi:hypothetical protein